MNREHFGNIVRQNLQKSLGTVFDQKIHDVENYYWGMTWSPLYSRLFCSDYWTYVKGMINELE